MVNYAQIQLVERKEYKSAYSDVICHIWTVIFDSEVSRWHQLSICIGPSLCTIGVKLTVEFSVCSEICAFLRVTRKRCARTRGPRARWRDRR